MANSLTDCLDVLRGTGFSTEQVLLIGGGARSRALRSGLADMLGRAVAVPEVREYVAIGAARQAVWAATGQLPSWGRHIEDIVTPVPSHGADDYRRRYIQRRAALVEQAAHSSPGS